MRRLFSLVLLLGLTACASEAPPDASPEARTAHTREAVEGSWVYCSGPTVLDTEAAFEGERVSTYIDGRPGLVGDYEIQGADLVLPDVRYPAGVEGPLLRLTTEDGPAVYARTGSDCPSGAAATEVGTYEIPPHAGRYDGDLDLSPEVRLCHADDRTASPPDRGMEACYVVALQQREDGSLSGTGTKVAVWRAGESSDRLVPSDLAPSEREAIRVAGHIDHDDVVHLRYTVGDGRRGVARYGEPVYTDWGGGVTDLTAIEGTFRAEEGVASGTARLDFEVE